MENYGKELILDLHQCSTESFNRESLVTFFHTLCDRINMEACEIAWWDDLDTPENEKETEPHLVGTSAVQFIKTSNITIHTLDMMERVYLNIFSCKDFDHHAAAEFCETFFKGKIVKMTIITRK